MFKRRNTDFFHSSIEYSFFFWVILNNHCLGSISSFLENKCYLICDLIIIFVLWRNGISLSNAIEVFLHQQNERWNWQWIDINHAPRVFPKVRVPELIWLARSTPHPIASFIFDLDSTRPYSKWNLSLRDVAFRHRFIT